MTSEKQAYIVGTVLLLLLVSLFPVQPVTGAPSSPSTNATDQTGQIHQGSSDLPDDCSSCHEIKSSYKIVFWENCQQCHTAQSGVKNTRSFVAHPEHANTELNLTNLSTVPDDHRSLSEPGMLNCQSCHNTGGQECQSCHGTFHNTQESCDSCHNQLGELPTHTVAPMGGSHEGFRCSKCHNEDMGYLANIYDEKVDFARADTICEGCHRSTVSQWKDGEHYAPEFQPTGGLLDSNMTRDEWAREYTCASCHDPHRPDAASAPQAVEGDTGPSLLVQGVKWLLSAKAQLMSLVKDVGLPTVLMVSGILFILLGGLQMLLSHLWSR